MLEHQENCRIFGHKAPQYLWFVLSGAICDTVQAFLDYLVSNIYTLEWQKPTVCWTVSYVLSIVVRHFSHRILVFGDYEGTYWQSLIRTFGAYSGSIILSIFTNSMLTDYLKVGHRNAWIITMIWTGIFNYFMLKKAWKPKVHEKVTDELEVAQLL